MYPYSVLTAHCVLGSDSSPLQDTHVSSSLHETTVKSSLHEHVAFRDGSITTRDPAFALHADVMLRTHDPPSASQQELQQLHSICGTSPPQSAEMEVGKTSFEQKTSSRPDVKPVSLRSKVVRVGSSPSELGTLPSIIGFDSTEKKSRDCHCVERFSGNVADKLLFDRSILSMSLRPLHVSGIGPVNWLSENQALLNCFRFPSRRGRGPVKELPRTSTCSTEASPSICSAIVPAKLLRLRVAKRRLGWA
mmetsp:Transcript_56231/g.136294  ORF Transcript_56231/g.136294 Transcript_56231/m.136294 type:complete len:249 (-) Transcript_56231:209-955(-)